MKRKTLGCVAAISVFSMVSELAMGKILEVAKAIINKSTAEAPDGLPKGKLHWCNLGAEALGKAIED